MIAFKTFAQLEESQRPVGIPLAWPSEEINIEEIDIISWEHNGFTVVSQDQYNSYKLTHQAAFDLWLQSTADSVVYYKIYDFVTDKKKWNTLVPPIDLDFRSGLSIVLHRKSYLVKGECVKEEYYQTCTVDAVGNLTYTNLIVSEHHSFTRDPLGFPIVRTSHLKFYDKSGNASGIIKPWAKYYSSTEKIQEGKTRRGNLVDNLQMPCIGLISLAMTGSPIPTSAVILEGRRFLFDYKKEFDSFVDESNRDIIQCFSNPNHPRYASASNYNWINTMTPYGVTIRQFLIAELTI